MIHPFIVREPPFKKALLLSLAVHLLSVSAFYLPRIWRGPKIIYYPVQIMPIGPAAGQAAAAAATTQPAPPVEQAKPAKTTKLEPIKGTIAIPKVKPGKAPPALAPTTGTKAAAPAKPLYSLMAGDEEELPTGFGGFVGIIRDKVGRSWKPLWWSGAEIRRCEIHFVLLKDGTVKDLEIKKPSGLPYLDRSALRALTEAQPFPPLPEGFIGDGLGITFRFELNREAQ